MLVKIFTGYESVFAQRGALVLSIQFPIIVALTWLCFDPLLQAVYVVRAFKWEGLRTGEDLLVRLKRLAPILALLALSAPHATLFAEPTPALSRDELNQSIDRTLQSRDYAWRIPPAATGRRRRIGFSIPSTAPSSGSKRAGRPCAIFGPTRSTGLIACFAP